MNSKHGTRKIDSHKKGGLHSKGEATAPWSSDVSGTKSDGKKDHVTDH